MPSENNEKTKVYELDITNCKLKTPDDLAEYLGNPSKNDKFVEELLKVKLRTISGFLETNIEISDLVDYYSGVTSDKPIPAVASLLLDFYQTKVDIVSKVQQTIDLDLPNAALLATVENARAAKKEREKAFDTMIKNFLQKVINTANTVNDDESAKVLKEPEQEPPKSEATPTTPDQNQAVTEGETTNIQNEESFAINEGETKEVKTNNPDTKSQSTAEVVSEESDIDRLFSYIEAGNIDAFTKLYIRKITPEERFAFIDKFLKVNGLKKEDAFGAGVVARSTYNKNVQNKILPSPRGLKNENGLTLTKDFFFQKKSLKIADNKEVVGSSIEAILDKLLDIPFDKESVFASLESLSADGKKELIQGFNIISEAEKIEPNASTESILKAFEAFARNNRVQNEAEEMGNYIKEANQEMLIEYLKDLQNLDALGYLTKGHRHLRKKLEAIKGMTSVKSNNRTFQFIYQGENYELIADALLSSSQEPKKEKAKPKTTTQPIEKPKSSEKPLTKEVEARITEEDEFYLELIEEELKEGALSKETLKEIIPELSETGKQSLLAKLNDNCSEKIENFNDLDSIVEAVNQKENDSANKESTKKQEKITFESVVQMINEGNLTAKQIKKEVKKLSEKDEKVLFDNIMTSLEINSSTSRNKMLGVIQGALGQTFSKKEKQTVFNSFQKEKLQPSMKDLLLKCLVNRDNKGGITLSA